MEEETKDVNKMSMWKKVLIGFTGVVVTLMIVIYVAIDFIAQDINENWDAAESQSTFEYEEDFIPLQEEDQISMEDTDESNLVWEQQWDSLGEKQQYLAFGSHLYRVEDGSYRYSKEFVDVLYVIVNGWFSGISKSDLDFVLPKALNELLDTATGKEVYDALILFTELYNRDTIITGEGETPYEYISRMASPYASERCGFAVGEVHTFTSGTTCTYQGQDIWIEANGRTWKASANNEGGITINIYTTSPYLSEKAGYLVGMVCDFGDLGDLTYEGQDIWVNSSGLKYKAYKIDNGAIYVDVVRTYDNLYSSYTFAGPGETPISEREGYVVGDVIKYKHVFAGYGYTRTYQGNDVWLREFESGDSRWEVAAYNSEGELDWVDKLD